jgi:hypothetical protein
MKLPALVLSVKDRALVSRAAQPRAKRRQHRLTAEGVPETGTRSNLNGNWPNTIALPGALVSSGRSGII